MKVFYSAEEIEDLAARGETQLYLEDDAVLTDLARDTAQRLGISLIYRSETGPVSPVSAPSVRTARAPGGAKVEFWAKLAAPRASGVPANAAPSAAGGQGGSNSMIDRAIGLVRQLADRSSDT